MGTAILHNRVIKKGGGMPEYTFDGTHTVIDDGSESGTWQIALTSTGTLTLTKAAKGITVKAQGGGGSGGAYSSRNGSDGKDGEIVSYEGELAVGTYAVTIGAGGRERYDTSGSKGGTTTFGELLTAAGGAGGAYNGGAKLEHASIYSTYGMGAIGGTKSHHSYNVDTGVTRYYGPAGFPGVVVLSGKA